jgi:hypothetical protein
MPTKPLSINNDNPLDACVGDRAGYIPKKV